MKKVATTSILAFSLAVGGVPAMEAWQAPLQMVVVQACLPRRVL